MRVELRGDDEDVGMLHWGEFSKERVLKFCIPDGDSGDLSCKLSTK